MSRVDADGGTSDRRLLRQKPWILLALAVASVAVLVALAFPISFTLRVALVAFLTLFIFLGLRLSAAGTREANPVRVARLLRDYLTSAAILVGALWAVFIFYVEKGYKSWYEAPVLQITVKLSPETRKAESPRFGGAGDNAGDELRFARFSVTLANVGQTKVAILAQAMNVCGAKHGGSSASVFDDCVNFHGFTDKRVPIARASLIVSGTQRATGILDNSTRANRPFVNTLVIDPGQIVVSNDIQIAIRAKDFDTLQAVAYVLYARTPTREPMSDSPIDEILNRALPDLQPRIRFKWHKSGFIEILSPGRRNVHGLVQEDELLL
jgi:hypothetical protein